MAARDALATPRVLVHHDGMPADRLVRWLTETWPAARVAGPRSASRASGPDLEGWLHDGVELIDDPTWAWHEGRCHSPGLLGPDPPRELRTALDATQPQAARVGLDELDGLLPAGRSDAGALRVLSEAGIAPPPWSPQTA